MRNSAKIPARHVCEKGPIAYKDERDQKRDATKAAPNGPGRTGAGDRGTKEQTNRNTDFCTKMTKDQSIEAQTKPAWKDLPPEIRNAWIEQTQAFYPPGSTTLEDAAELAQSEYEQSESDSVHPPSEQPAEPN